MLPLFDMMLAAQNGQAMDSLAKQFGLAQEQVAKAMAALVPAFSTGLKRQAADPMGFSQLLGSAMSGNYTQYFEDMAKAFTPQGISQGNNVLGQIFGSKEISRAIADQAARMTGVGQDVLKQMLPAMASAIMGGLMKQGMGQMPNAADFWSGTPQAQMVEQWMQATGLAPKAKPQAPDLFDNPFTQVFTQMLGQTAKKEEPVNPFAGNPFVDMMGSMMSAMMPGQTPVADDKQTDDEPAKTAANGYSDLVNAMFDSGIDVQKNYQKSMDSIFDTYLSAMKGGTPPKE